MLDKCQAVLHKLLRAPPGEREIERQLAKCQAAMKKLMRAPLLFWRESEKKRGERKRESANIIPSCSSKL